MFSNIIIIKESRLTSLVGLTAAVEVVTVVLSAAAELIAMEGLIEVRVVVIADEPVSSLEQPKQRQRWLQGIFA